MDRRASHGRFAQEHSIVRRRCSHLGVRVHYEGGALDIYVSSSTHICCSCSKHDSLLKWSIVTFHKRCSQIGHRISYRTPMYRRWTLIGSVTDIYRYKYMLTFQRRGHAWPMCSVWWVTYYVIADSCSVENFVEFTESWESSSAQPCSSIVRTL